MVKRTESEVSKRCLRTRAHSGFIHDSQKDGSNLSAHHQMNAEDKMQYIHKMKIHTKTYKKENSDPYYYMDELSTLCQVEISQSITKEHRSDSTSMRYLEESNSQRQKVQWWLPGPRGRRTGVFARATKLWQKHVSSENLT